MVEKIFRSTAFWLVLSITVCVVVYWRWFFTLDIYSWGDWGYQNKEYFQQILSFPQAWLREFLGMVDIGLPQYITTRLFYPALATIFPFVIYDRIAYLMPTVLVPAVGMFFLLRQYSKNGFVGFVGVLVYAFNSYILTLNTGELTLSMAYSFAPFVFIFFRLAILKHSLKYLILASFFGLISASYDPRGFYLVSFILLLYLGFSLFFHDHENAAKLNTASSHEMNARINRRYKLKSIFLGLLFFVLIILYSMYWLIAVAKTLGSYQGIAINTTIVGQLSYLLPRPLLLFSPWWTGGHGIDAWIVQAVPWYFWFIPVFAFLGFWLNRRRPDVLFWVVIALLGIFLTKNYGDPFGAIYPWLYAHIPGFNAFRDSAKFYFLICISYAVLIGFFVDWLWTTKSILKAGKIALSLIVAGIFIYNGQFVFRQQVGHLMVPRKIPNDYIIFKNYTFKQNQFMRTLYVPQYSHWIFRDVDHRALGLASLLGGDWSKFDNYKKVPPAYSFFDNMTKIFSENFANQLLDSWSIKYVVVPIDEKSTGDSVYPKGTNREDFVKYLSTVPYLKRVNIGTEKLAIFENANPSPHFVFTPAVNYTVNCPDATTCTFVFNSSAKYAEFYYAETYHPGWKLKFGEFSWWQSLLQKNYFQPDSLHQRSEFGGNVFLLPEVKPGQKMTLYFAPQAYVNVGTIVSASVFGGSLIVLVYVILRKRRNKSKVSDAK